MANNKSSGLGSLNLGSLASGIVGLFGSGNNADLHGTQNSANLLGKAGGGLLGASSAPINAALSQILGANSGFNQANQAFSGVADQTERQALSPEINQVLQQFSGNRRARGNLTARGGGASSANANDQFSEMGAIGNLLGSGYGGYMNSKLSAAQGLISSAGGIQRGGTDIGNIGLNEAGLGESALNSSGNLYMGAQKLNDLNSGKTGSAIGGILSDLFSGKGGGFGGSIIGDIGKGLLGIFGL